MTLPTALILSGLSREQFSEDVQFLFQKGDALLKSPGASSIASSDSGSQTSTAESGISSLSGDDVVPKKLPYYFDVLSILDRNFKGIANAAALPDSQDLPVLSTEKPKITQIEIIYGDRDILNLGEHLTTKWPFQCAELKNGVSDFFENRSRFSRVNGAPMLPHVMVICEEKDCNFSEPTYY